MLSTFTDVAILIMCYHKKTLFGHIPCMLNDQVGTECSLIVLSDHPDIGHVPSIVADQLGLSDIYEALSVKPVLGDVVSV